MAGEHFEKAVIDLARLLGLRVAHFRPVQVRPGRWITPVAADAKGFPDLVIAGPGGVLLPELKSGTGGLEPEQRKWQAALGEYGRVWREADLHDGTIERELRALRKARP